MTVANNLARKAGPDPWEKRARYGKPIYLFKIKGMVFKM